MKYSIGITDDHPLFVQGLSELINKFDDFQVTLNAYSGEQLLSELTVQQTKPDILLIDVNMPGLGGMLAASSVNKQYPLIRIIALSMNDTEQAILGMIRAGCVAYLSKGMSPDQLRTALVEVAAKGFYHGDTGNINYTKLLKESARGNESTLSENERVFLQHACSDLTYKNIASKMNKSERTIDGYRESVFEKLNVQSRVGMVLEGLKRGLISIQ